MNASISEISRTLSRLDNAVAHYTRVVGSAMGSQAKRDAKRLETLLLVTRTAGQLAIVEAQASRLFAAK